MRDQRAQPVQRDMPVERWRGTHELWCWGAFKHEDVTAAQNRASETAVARHATAASRDRRAAVTVPRARAPATRAGALRCNRATCCSASVSTTV